MKLTPLGGAQEIGASCHLLEVDGRHILFDSGLRPNRRGDASLPDFRTLESLTGGRLDLILVSHAHIDHTGSLPLAHAQYPGTPTYCTPPTRVIAEILLQDTIRIMRMQHDEEGSEFPLFSEEDVERTLFLLREAPFDTWFEPVEGIRVRFHRSGHIVGAAAILLDTPEGKVVYSGDVSSASQRTAAGMTKIDFFQPDVLILEGTYGDSAHASRRTEEQNLARAVSEVVQAGGTVLIPSFALGRAQELILILKSAMLSSTIEPFPLCVDGMVRAICDAYIDLLEYLPTELRNYVRNSRRHVFWSSPHGKMPGVLRLRPSDRITMFTGDPKCIIASSGMLVGGPSQYYARVLAVDPKNAIFFTGYQDEESPGRRLAELERGGTLRLGDDEIPVNCLVQKYNLSAHADQVQLCQQASYMAPKSIVLVHGDPGALRVLRGKLTGRYIVYTPGNGETVYPLDTPSWMTDAKQRFLRAEKERFVGRVTTDDSGVTIRFDGDLRESPGWDSTFGRSEDAGAGFAGSRLEVRGPGRRRGGPDQGESGE